MKLDRVALIIKATFADATPLNAIVIQHLKKIY